jgi:glycosyltransferase involved in cell wall biosynthesis
MVAFRLDLTLLNASAWISRQPWLQLIYRRFPQAWRAGILKRISVCAENGLRFERKASWDRGADNALAAHEGAPSRPLAGPGVNIQGYLRGEFGLAESARMYARALIEGGFKVALNDIDLQLPHGWSDRSLDPWIVDDAPYPNSIIFVNPDFLAPALEEIGSERLQGRRLIACWFWELETVPEQWLPAIEVVDEIMVASSFVEAAFRRVTDKPIVRIPLPLYRVQDSGLQREDFGIDPDKFVFLCTFDFQSSIERKNPFAAIQAFRLAFPPQRHDVSLLIKSSNGHRAIEQLRRLLNAASEDPRIVVRDDVIPRAHVQALQRCCDAYVSLHRAEGFGLGMAESMALGKPVIATGWSGNVDFMDAENSILVDYRLIPVGAGEYPDSDGARWADPDLEAAAAAMLKLVDEPGLARKLGDKARESVKRQLSSTRIAEQLNDWLCRPVADQGRADIDNMKSIQAPGT